MLITCSICDIKLTNMLQSINMLQSSMFKNAAIQSANATRTQIKKGQELKNAAKPGSHVGQALATSTARVAFQVIPNLLANPPKTPADAAKVATKAIYWGLIYNIAPKLLNKVKPELKNKTLNGWVDDGIIAGIAGTGFTALSSALGGSKFDLKSIKENVFDEAMDAVGGNLAADITSKFFKDKGKVAKTISNIALATPLTTMFQSLQNPKNIKNPKAYRGTLFFRTAVSVNSSYGKSLGKIYDGIFGWKPKG